MNVVSNLPGIPLGGTIPASNLMEQREREIAERKSRIIRERMSPKGALGLPARLDAARLEYGITDSAFAVSASFNTVFVWQVPMQEGETFKGSSIIMPETTRAREKNRAPVGVIISAGMLALDALRSNGLDLGHKVVFVHAAPYHIRYDVVEGQDFHLIVLEAGQIRGSYELADDLKTRRVRIIQNPNNLDAVEHILIDENGKPVLPQAPVES